MRSTILLLALPVLIAAQAAPAPVPAPCPTPAAPLPPSLAGWKPGLSLAAATDKTSLVQAKLVIGTRVEGMLVPTDSVRFLHAPGKPGEPLSKGGMFSLRIAVPGTYRVALGTGAWIDVVRNGEALVSVAHAMGAACSGLRKTVDFKLRPGAYILQIEGSKDAVAPLLVTRLP